MNIVELKCPQCGANLEVNEEKTEAECPYCKYKCILEKEKTLEEKVKESQEISYAMKTGEKLAEEDSEKRTRKETSKRVIKAILIIVGICIICFLISYIGKKKIDDPFELINVSFSGISGEGKANIDMSKIDTSEITFEISKDSNLKEGEVIEIVAKSEDFRFGKSHKKYKVTGLLSYISNIDELSDETIKFINEKSSKYLEDCVKDEEYRKIVSIEPYKIYLLTDGKKNKILDMFLVKIQTKSGNVFDKYECCAYEDVILTEDEDVIRFSAKYNMGNNIYAGRPGELNAGSKDYAKFITGFYSIDDFKEYIIKHEDISMKLYEK